MKDASAKKPSINLKKTADATTTKTTVGAGGRTAQ